MAGRRSPRGPTTAVAGADPRSGGDRARHQHQPGRARDWLYDRTPATPRPRRRRAHRRPGVSPHAAGPAARGADRRGDPRGSRAAGRCRPGGPGPRFARRKADALTYFTRKEFTPGAGAKFLLYWTSRAGWPRLDQTGPGQVGVVPPVLPWMLPSSRSRLNPMNSPLIEYCPSDPVPPGLASSTGLWSCGPSCAPVMYIDWAEASKTVPQIWQLFADPDTALYLSLQVVPAVFVEAM